jgi:phospholipid/cholesterol/gamma-HCH transport system substrate-binding protein
MNSKREQALVGLFVLIATGLLLATIFALTGAFTGGAVQFRTYLPFAGGIEPGAEVRYLGGPKIGRVEQLRLDPNDSSRIEITFSVKPEIPIKADSKVKILSLSPLGENHLEIAAGSAQARPAQAGSVLPSEPYVGFNDITAQLNTLAPELQKLLGSLNDRAVELKETIARVNDLINDQNRTSIAASLSNVRGMLEENRPKIKSTMTNVETASARVAPLLDDFKTTVKRADDALAHLDQVLGENRADVRQAVADLRKTLASAASLTAQLDNTFNYNAENIDEILENIRHTTENLKEFTDTVKARPFSLIRGSSVPDRKPGENKKP